MPPLSVGVVGLGLGRHHVEGYASSPAVGRIAVCDPNEERVADVRAAWPKVHASYASLEDMLGSEHLDAISVTTPDHLHRPHAVRCLEAGCHVLLAKPIATTLEDARAIVTTAETSSRILMLAHERRYRPGFRYIKDLLDEGVLGEIIHLTIDSIQDKREQFRHAPWYASTEAGRSAIVGSGIHQVDLVRYLVGRPVESVYALSNRLGGLAFPRDKTTSALFRFGNGTVGQVTITYEAHWPPSHRLDGTHFRLIGSKGVIMDDQVAIDGRDAWQPIPHTEDGVRTGTLGCVEAFLACLVEGAQVPVTGREAYASLAACIAADLSAETGHPVVPASAHF